MPCKIVKMLMETKKVQACLGGFQYSDGEYLIET